MRYRIRLCGSEVLSSNPDTDSNKLVLYGSDLNSVVREATALHI